MTAIFIDSHGDYQKCLPVAGMPTAEVLLELAHSHPDFGLIFRPKGNYTDAGLEEWSRSTVEGFEVFESGKLPPGWRHLP
jgi:hypothetical protein